MIIIKADFLATFIIIKTMQTKLLLAALAAISSRTANAKKDGDRVDSVGEKLVEIYERCKLHIEGNNF